MGWLKKSTKKAIRREARRHAKKAVRDILQPAVLAYATKGRVR